jgi:hypothetical protein
MPDNFRSVDRTGYCLLLAEQTFHSSDNEDRVALYQSNNQTQYAVNQRSAYVENPARAIIMTPLSRSRDSHLDPLGGRKSRIRLTHLQSCNCGTVRFPCRAGSSLRPLTVPIQARLTLIFGRRTVRHWTEVRPPSSSIAAQFAGLSSPQG